MNEILIKIHWVKLKLAIENRDSQFNKLIKRIEGCYYNSMWIIVFIFTFIQFTFYYKINLMLMLINHFHCIQMVLFYFYFLFNFIIFLHLLFSNGKKCFSKTLNFWIDNFMWWCLNCKDKDDLGKQESE